MGERQFRVGQGYDVHPFCDGRPLVLGGITVPHNRGLAGHSDADALLHAVTDAVLGATGRGDIGSYFPDSDPQWAGADSAELLRAVWNEICGDGWRLENIDVTVIAEAPRVKPYVGAMKERIAGIFGTEVDRIGLKATTSEKMGFVGRQEGLAVHCVALLSR